MRCVEVENNAKARLASRRCWPRDVGSRRIALLSVPARASGASGGPVAPKTRPRSRAIASESRGRGAERATGGRRAASGSSNRIRVRIEKSPRTLKGVALVLFPAAPLARAPDKQRLLFLRSTSASRSSHCYFGGGRITLPDHPRNKVVPAPRVSVTPPALL